MDDLAEFCRALSSVKRREILFWLKDPKSHFRKQVDGDLVEDGVCARFIAEKLEVSQPTAAQHLKVLTQANLLISKRIKTWTFYRRDEIQISKFISNMAAELLTNKEGDL